MLPTQLAANNTTKALLTSRQGANIYPGAVELIDAAAREYGPR
jgi:hypothetical protein